MKESGRLGVSQNPGHQDSNEFASSTAKILQLRASFVAGQEVWDSSPRGNDFGVCVDDKISTSISSVSRVTEPAISPLPQAGDDPELFQLEEHSVPKAVPKLAAAPSTPPASNSKAPLAVHTSSLPTTSLPTEQTAPTVSVPDHGGPTREKPNTLLLTTGLHQHHLELGKSASKAKPLNLRDIPEPLCNGLVRLRMPNVLTNSSLLHQ